MRSGGGLRLTGRTSQVRRVPDSLRSAQCIAGPQGMGHRFRGLVCTFEGSRSVNSGWIQKHIELASRLAHCLWTHSLCRVPQRRTICGNPPFLRPSTGIATNDISDGLFPFSTSDSATSNQKKPVIKVSSPNEQERSDGKFKRDRTN